MHVRMFPYYLFHLLRSKVGFAAVVGTKRAKGSHQWVVRLACVVELALCVFKLPQVKINERAIVAGDHVSRRIETHQAVVATERSAILSIEPMQCGLNKV